MKRSLVTTVLFLFPALAFSWISMAAPALWRRERLPATRETAAHAGPEETSLTPAESGAGLRGAVPAGEAPSAAPSAGPAGFEVEACAAGGVRLTAVVSVEDELGPRVLGLTTPERLLAIDATTAAFPMRLIASTENEPRLVGELVLARQPALRAVAIELGTACALRGTVVDHEQKPLPAGVRVVALDLFRARRWLEERRADREPLPDGRWAETVTDRDGRFALSGLLADRSYCLHAAGRGFSTSERGAQVQYACGDEVMLAVQPLFGGIVRVGTPGTDDRVREASRVLFGPVRLLGWPARSFPRDIEAEPALIGTALERQARLAREEGRRVLAVTGAEDMPLLHMQVQLRVPFLPETTHAIALPRLGEALAEIELSVAEPEGAVLALEVVSLTVPGSLERLGPDAEVAELRLSRAGRTTEVVVRAEPLLAGFSVPGLPPGAYEWALHYPGGGRFLPRTGEPPARVAVGEGGGLLLLDLTWAAAAELTILDAAGIPYAGPIQATFGAPNGAAFTDPEGRQVVGFDDVATYSWKQGPYLVPCLPPGEYQVACSADFGRRMKSGYSRFHRFEAGRVTQVELQTR
jgi:hypothetical protein